MCTHAAVDRVTNEPRPTLRAGGASGTVVTDTRAVDTVACAMSIAWARQTRATVARITVVSFRAGITRCPLGVIQTLSAHPDAVQITGTVAIASTADTAVVTRPAKVASTRVGRNTRAVLATRYRAHGGARVAIARPAGVARALRQRPYDRASRVLVACACALNTLGALGSLPGRSGAGRRVVTGARVGGSADTVHTRGDTDGSALAPRTEITRITHTVGLRLRTGGVNARGVNVAVVHAIDTLGAIGSTPRRRLSPWCSETFTHTRCSAVPVDAPLRADRRAPSGAVSTVSHGASARQVAVDVDGDCRPVDDGRSRRRIHQCRNHIGVDRLEAESVASSACIRGALGTRRPSPIGFAAARVWSNTRTVVSTRHVALWNAARFG